MTDDDENYDATNTLTKEEREAARERCEAATEGSWQRIGMSVTRGVDGEDPKRTAMVADCFRSGRMDDAYSLDAAFIAHARTDLPKALDTIDAMEAQIDALQRGRIAKWHAEQVTEEMLRAYLEASEGWSVRSNDAGHSWWQCSEDGFSAYVRPGRIRATISNVALGEGRGELAVWCDIVGGEGE